MAEGNQLGDDHLHRVVTRMGIPVTAAAIDRDQGHRWQRVPVDQEGDCLVGDMPVKALVWLAP